MRKKTDKNTSHHASQRKSPSTKAGEFVREEIHHVREGKHGARSAKQAIAIGLSKARKAGVPLAGGARKSSKKVSKKKSVTSRTRSTAILRALKKEGHASASHRSLSQQAHKTAKKRKGST